MRWVERLPSQRKATQRALSPPWDQRIAVRQRCAHNRGIIRARVCIIDPLSPILQDLAIQPFGKQALRIGSCMAAGRTGEGGMISTLPRE